MDVDDEVVVVVDVEPSDPSWPEVLEREFFAVSLVADLKPSPRQPERSNVDAQIVTTRTFKLNVCIKIVRNIANFAPRLTHFYIMQVRCQFESRKPLKIQ